MKTFNPPGTPATQPPPRKPEWDHSERVLVYYPASQELCVGEAWGIAYYHYNPPFEKARWIDFHHNRQPALWWPLPAEMPEHDHVCHCGTATLVPHNIGSNGCLRRMVEAPILVGRDRWSVDGFEITGYSLREQRGYHQHLCGCWSRSPGSTNSLDPDD